jgi:flagellar export protein FliJ
MRRFRFTIDTVLRVRRGRQDKIEKEYAAILRERTQRLYRLGKLEQNLRDLSQDQNQARSRGQRLNLGLETFYETQRESQRKLVTQAQVALAQIEVALERKRLELVEAARDTAVLEKLEEAQKKAYLAKVNKEEQAFMDELAQHINANAA